MNRFDFFSGQPVQQAYPMSGTNMTNQQVGGYQVGTITPGAYGYNQGPQAGFMNQYTGPSYTPQPNLQTQNFQGYAGNPALAMLQQNNMNGGGGLGFQPYGWNPYAPQQPQQYQDKVVHIPGLNFGSDAMFPDDLEERVEKLQLDMMIEQEEADLKRQKNFQGYFNANYGAYNYYGIPYYANTVDQSVQNKYRQILMDMRQEAVQRRTNFNKHLSRLAHNFIGDGATDEDIDRVYDGYTYTIPAVQVAEDARQEELKRFVPVSNQQAYVKHHNEVHNAYQALLGNNENMNMNEFLQAQGVIQVADMLEESYAKRRDTTRYYQEDSYKRFLRKAIMERNGITAPANQGQLPMAPGENIPFGNSFPTLNQAAKILDDGTISISAPNHFGVNNNMNRQIVLDNEMEKHFAENRQRFLQSIYNQGDG